LPSWREIPDVFEVDFLERAGEPGTIFGSKAVGEPPLMLAISVREAIREAISAYGATFGSRGIVELDSPATPERVYWAIQLAGSAQMEIAEPAAEAVAEPAAEPVRI